MQEVTGLAIVCGLGSGQGRGGGGGGMGGGGRLLQEVGVNNRSCLESFGFGGGGRGASDADGGGSIRFKRSGPDEFSLKLMVAKSPQAQVPQPRTLVCLPRCSLPFELRRLSSMGMGPQSPHRAACIHTHARVTQAVVVKEHSHHAAIAMCQLHIAHADEVTPRRSQTALLQAHS